jgi:hypothetical protein
VDEFAVCGEFVAFALVGTGWTADDPRVFVVGAVNRPGVFDYSRNRASRRRSAVNEAPLSTSAS